MAQKTIQYVVEISHDEDIISPLEADLTFRERMAGAFDGVFPLHIGRVQ
jgi:hypothetical protein